jgi:hypothetical protein
MEFKSHIGVKNKQFCRLSQTEYQVPKDNMEDGNEKTYSDEHYNGLHPC